MHKDSRELFCLSGEEVEESTMMPEVLAVTRGIKSNSVPSPNVNAQSCSLFFCCSQQQLYPASHPNLKICIYGCMLLKNCCSPGDLTVI